MIVTVTPNPAIDITYAVHEVTLGASHRVGSVHERAGGKGLNVAAVLTTMGRDSVAVAPVGRREIPFFDTDLQRRGIAHRLVESPCPTRRSIAVLDAAGEATLFNESGAAQPATVWQAVVQVLASLSEPGSVLTISGSLPEQAPVDLVATLTGIGEDRGVPVVVDTAGAPLVAALSQRPTLVKPNRVEAESATAALGRGAGGIAALLRILVDAGARAAVISDGADGLHLLHEDVALHARLREPLAGNPTGAGDALTAALATELETAGGLPQGPEAWARALRRGGAWSAAAVLQPVAGAVDPADIERLAAAVDVKESRR
ncbi:MAG: hexose kinase [Intrasporangium sp.]|uniref:1-phosphofructokinase family hexose kinase n=1 Tax=Intrasporangium sp. TaxID=1925024 RepID=UPI00264973C9|nr:hexose kinase [Intrasporangium sp.]MDN5796328.1 hexose kinase [Intrasporangium sp.]